MPTIGKVERTDQTAPDSAHLHGDGKFGDWSSDIGSGLVTGPSYGLSSTNLPGIIATHAVAA